MESLLVAEIGLIIGCYVITRMIDIMTRKGEQAPNAFLMAVAVVTLLLTGLMTISLGVRGFSGVQ
jgi:hypothetical protein